MSRKSGPMIMQAKMVPGTEGTAHQNYKLSLTDPAGWDWEEWGVQGFGKSGSTAVSAEHIYNSVGWSRRCVNLLGWQLANLPWELHREGASVGADPIWISGEPVPTFLDPIKHMRRILRLTEMSMALEGAAYFLKLREGGRAVTGVQYMDPRSIKLETAPMEGITAYIRTVKRQDGTQKEITLAPEDVVAVFATNPYVELGVGPSDAKAAVIHGAVLEAISGFAHKFLSTGGVKATLLTSEERISTEELNRLETWWRGFVGGGWNKDFGAKVVNSKLVPVTIGEGLEGLSNSSMSMDERKAVATGYGVPYSLLDGEASTDANMKADQLNLLIMTVIPAAQEIAPQWNESFLEPDLGVSLRFRPDKHELLQQEELAKAERVSLLVGAPVLTVDEGRDLLGYGPVKDSELQRTADDQKDVRLWKAKVKSTGRRDVEFTPNHLNRVDSALIRDRLRTDMALDEVFKLPL